MYPYRLSQYHLTCYRRKSASPPPPKLLLFNTISHLTQPKFLFSSSHIISFVSLFQISQEPTERTEQGKINIRSSYQETILPKLVSLENEIVFAFNYSNCFKIY